MPVTNYTTLDGEVLYENRAGIERDYVPDPLGITVYRQLVNLLETNYTWQSSCLSA